METCCTEYDFLLKILVLGDSGVGKTSLLYRYTEDTFLPAFIPTIGVDFKIRTVAVAGRTVKVQLWDTAGQERFRAIVRSFYKGAHGVLLVYDVTDEASFLSLGSWLEEVEECASPALAKVLVANKTDMPERQVDRKRAQGWAEQQGLGMVETSARSHQGVEEVFLGMVKGLLEELVGREGREGREGRGQSREEVLGLGEGREEGRQAGNCLCY